MVCCGECFGDEFLSRRIAAKSSDIGNCEFCGATDVAVLPPLDLFDVFQPVLGLYEAVPDDGLPIAELLPHDWLLFPKMPPETATALIDQINGTDWHSRNQFKPKHAEDSDAIENWDTFCEELKFENRYFPRAIPERSYLENLFDFVVTAPNEAPEVFYRARVGKGSCVYPIDQMGKPPRGESSGGRANPFGISYLYTGSTEKTAVAEIRPHKGEIVTVAEFGIAEERELQFVDLRSPRSRISPFEIEEDKLRLIYAGMEYLCRLGDELTKPVQRHKANLDYLPCQYLCELIKHQGRDGVIYASSVGDGDNYAIFDDSSLVGRSVRGVEIVDTDLQFEAI
jgi:hypothetical protein